MRFEGVNLRCFPSLLSFYFILICLVGKISTVRVQISSQNDGNLKSSSQIEAKFSAERGNKAKTTTEEPESGSGLNSSTSSIISTADQRNKSAKRKFGNCEYEKGPWEVCQSNALSGIQRRTLKLKGKENEEMRAKEEGKSPSSSFSSSSSQCEPIKTIDRECKLVGCKYARGEWSSFCSSDGKRSRIDTLMGPLSSTSFKCPAKRTVTKDCRRTCHYIKSVWSECVDGFKSRNLTLDSSFSEKEASLSKSTLVSDFSPSSSSSSSSSSKSRSEFNGCAKERLIRRPCRLHESTSSKQTSSELPAATTTSKSSGKTPKMTAQQKRRRQQKQQKLQQQKLAPITNSSSSGSSSQQALGRSNGLLKQQQQQQQRRRR